MPAPPPNTTSWCCVSCCNANARRRSREHRGTGPPGGCACRGRAAAGRHGRAGAAPGGAAAGRHRHGAGRRRQRVGPRLADPGPCHPRRRCTVNIGKRARARPADVVDAVRSQTTQAAQLSDIAAQRLLGDPRTNPATRGHADTLRNTQQRAELDAEHTRRLRRIRVDDARAAHAERALEAIRAAREAHSPARAVTALTRGRRRYGNVALAASLALSVGSAMGTEALASSWEAPWGVGYLAECGMTGLA